MITKAMRGAILAAGLAGAIALGSGCATGVKAKATAPETEPALTLESVLNAESRGKLRAALLDRAGEENAIYVDRALESFDHAVEMWAATAKNAGPRQRACLDTALLRLEAAVELVGRRPGRSTALNFRTAYATSAEAMYRISECRFETAYALYTPTQDTADPTAALEAERALARAAIADALRDRFPFKRAAIAAVEAASRSRDPRLQVEALLAALDLARYWSRTVPDVLPPSRGGSPEGIIKAAEAILPKARAAGHRLAEAELLATMAEARFMLAKTDSVAHGRCCDVQLWPFEELDAAHKRQGMVEAEQAFAVRERVLGESRPGSVVSHRVLAALDHAEGSVDHLSAALAWREKTLGPDHLLNLDLHETLAMTLRQIQRKPGDEKQLNRAAGHVRRALDIRRRSLPIDWWAEVDFYKRQIRLELAHRDVETAARVMRDALTDLGERPSIDAETRELALMQLSWAHMWLVEWPWAVFDDETNMRWLRACIEVGHELGMGHEDLDWLHVGLVSIHLRRTERDVAIDVATEYLDKLGKSSGPESGPDDAARIRFARKLVRIPRAVRQASYEGKTYEEKVELLAKAERQAARKTLLEVLAHHGVKTTRAVRRKIAACEDLDVLHVWIGEALTATSLDEVFYEDAQAGGSGQ
jgi:hypothetical protein